MQNEIKEEENYEGRTRYLRAIANRLRWILSMFVCNERKRRIKEVRVMGRIRQHKICLTGWDE